MKSVLPVFVVIPTCNLKDDLIACINSLFESSFVSLHIVVVDNGSTDGTVEALHQEFGNAVTVLCEKEKLGFARAVNKGIDYAILEGAGSILILNNDTYVDKYMLEYLVAALECRSDVGMVGPVIYYADFPERIWQIGSRQFLGPPLIWRSLPGSHPKHVLKVDYLTGCAMLVKKEVFEIVGGFDTDYYMYFEDADFCRRVQSAGFDMLVVTKAKMWHKISLSSRNLFYSRVYYQSRGRVIFLLRHAVFSLRFLASIYIWGYLLIHWAHNIWTGDIPAIKAAFQGTVAGYKFFYSNQTSDK